MIDFRLLRKVFALPSERTLQQVVHSVAVYPGFNQSVIDALKIKLSSTLNNAKLIALCMDEMSIKEGLSLSYDGGRDVVEGFTTS